jgi:cytochrome c
MKTILLIAFLCAPSALIANDAELLKAGEKAFRKCKACHRIGEGAKSGVGPALNNIVGLPAAAQPGFNYSGAMKTAAENGLIWDKASLVAFLQRPKVFVKGTKMSFSGLRKEKDIEAIFALLNAHTLPQKNAGSDAEQKVD